MKGLRVKAQAIPVATSIRSVFAGQVGGLGDRGAEQLRRPDALDPGRLGALRLGLEVGDRGADRGDGDAVERAHRGRPQAADRRGGAGEDRVGDPLAVPLGVAEHRRVGACRA